METWSSVLSEFAFWLWAEIDPANRECLTSQAIREIWIGGCGCSPGKRYHKIRTCLTGEVETSSSLIWMWDIRLEDPDMSDRRSWNVLLSHPAVRYPDVKYRRTEFFPGRNSSPGGMSYAAQGGPSACARCRDPSLWWHGARKTIRINSIRIPQEDMWRASLSGLP